MNVLILNQREIAQLLPVGTCIEVMAAALAAMTRGEVVLPLRPMMRLPEDKGLVAMMPAWLGEPRALGLKVISIMPGNQGTQYDSHPGIVLLLDAEHGQPLAIMDASEITAIRTAAVSGLATRLLAREDAAVLALLGSGVQARTHLEAMLAVRPLREVRVWSRTSANAQRFAEQATARHRLPVHAVASAEQAVTGADLICTVTASNEPVLKGAWLRPGAHVNAVGVSQRTARELDAAAVARSLLFVDRRESALNEAGDFLLAREEGAVSDDHILGEIGEVLLGRIPGRRSADDITLFKSLGLAIEDVAAAHYLYERAREQGAGTLVELGGERDG